MSILSPKSLQLRNQSTLGLEVKMANADEGREQELERLEHKLLNEINQIEKEVQGNITLLSTHRVGAANNSLRMEHLQGFKQNMTSKSFSKVFEMRDDAQWFYVLNQHNAKMNFENAHNPFYGEVTVNRYRQDKYLYKSRFGVSFGQGGRGQGVEEEPVASSGMD